MSDIERRLQAIELRNQRVELDKSWERSITRRVVIATMTWLTAGLFLWCIDVPSPLMNALVPSGGYLLSTLSLPPMKYLWNNIERLAKSSNNRTEKKII